jgi:ubiquinone/menaquinone biosynthesis C-methylase UbiE
MSPTPDDPNAIAESQKPIWNRSAHTYADVFDGQFTQAFAPTLDAAGVGKGARVLDVATGPGLLAGAAAERGAIATGIDFAEEMIAAARRLYPQIHFEVADATDLPFEDRSFDAVIVGFGIFLMAEPNKALNEAWRVLAPGGKLAFTIWDKDRPGHAVFYGPLQDYIKNPPDFSGPPWLDMNDPIALKAEVEKAGFVHPIVKKLPIVWEMTSAQRIFDAFSPMCDLSDISSEGLDALKADITLAAQAYERNGKLYIPFPALVVGGEKP